MPGKVDVGDDAPPAEVRLDQLLGRLLRGVGSGGWGGMGLDGV